MAEESKVKIFAPEGNTDLRITHPELGEIPEFVPLNKGEMLFVWYYGNITSPFYKIIHRTKKLQACVDKAFPHRKIDDRMRMNYLNGSFPVKIRAAVERMKMFMPDIRQQSNLLAQKILRTQRIMADLGDTEEEIRARMADMSHNDKKNYVEMSSNIIKNLPGLIAKVEGQFGVDEEGNPDIGIAGKNMMDSFHNQK